ncbi:T9SS type A sorting domain-containing protein [Brumimicrobium mesophilum]|uniref:T9SS type A sorting domain-containing protein n=1 Tax=Brumimicrobium mesophilum TaxID=392717 RepID=UPI000D142A6A|nr:T9SS type A sorting domain-containing protein [Brumimicrobium mesophilum]
MNKFYKKLRNLGLATVAVTGMVTSSMAQCTTEIAPYSEDFSGGALPACWENLSSGTTTAANNFWKFTGAPGYGATANGRPTGTYAWADGSTPNPDSINLITPLIDLSPLTTPSVGFSWFSNNNVIPGDNNPMRVDVFDGTTWTTIATFEGDDPAWQEEILDLSAYAGLTVKIRFSVDQSIAGTAFNNDILLDDVMVMEAPSCFKPTELTILNVTTTSVELSWVENNGATSDWIVEYGPSGFTPGSSAGTEVVVTTNPYTVPGLSPSSSYDFYVRTVCAPGDSSLQRGIYSTYTLCGIVVAPYYEGFNSGAQPQCWDNLATGGTTVNYLWKFDGNPGYGSAPAINGRPNNSYAWVDASYTSDSVMLTTPEIDISQLTTPYLAFEWFSSNTNTPDDTHPLIVEVYDGTSWNLLDTLLADSSEWMFVNYDLSAFSNNIIQVRFMLNLTTTTSSAFYTDILLDDIRIDDCISFGGVDGSLDICRLDSTVNLNDNIITKPNGGGDWIFSAQPTFLTEDSIFNVTYLPAGSYDVYYIERFVCYDTTFATINVFGPSSAGVDGSVTVCKNEPINLFGALTGNIDSDGDWLDFTNTVLPNSQPKAQPIPGNYNYIYIADNGVCPADTSIVTVTVDNSCDFLSLDDELFTDISVFPNPATSQLNIVNPSNAASLKVEMLDMNGRVVLVEDKALNNASNATIAIDHLEKGIYTLRVYNNEGQKSFKIVKQ